MLRAALSGPRSTLALYFPAVLFATTGVECSPANSEGQSPPPPTLPCRRVRAHYLLSSSEADEISVLKAHQSAHPKVDLTWSSDLPSERADIEVLIARLPSAALLDSLPALKSVIVPFAGPTELAKQLVRERPHLALHNSHFNAASTAELAVALLLAASKSVPAHDASFRAEIRAGEPWTVGWDPRAAPSPTLAGRRALVLGYGAIGARVSRTLAAMGMDVHAVRRSSPAAPTAPGGSSGGSGPATLHGPSDLDDLLRTAAAVVVCLPGTPATANLLGARELRLLPRGSVVVNVGRGSVVDEGALFAALEDGHLGGAGLDVWYNYPSLPGQGLGAGLANAGPSSLPFHRLGNVVMSPHRGQSSDSKAHDRVTELYGLLSQLAATGELPNRYDLDRGY